MVTVKLDPHELKFIVAAINQTQIMGKDSHLVSRCLGKFEDKLKNITQVQ